MPTIDVEVKTNAGDLLIIISDNGEGMTDEVKEHLYENFFTTKPIGHGTGLGMGITREIIEEKHHGKITFESKQGEGTSFTFTIPIRTR
jgi:signal transduction histidine kinase